jgi:carbonic anhydrase
MSNRRVSAADALKRLREGNDRFVENDRCIDTYLSHTKLDDHLAGQAPFAIVLGCSDSRVPVEIIFDVGLGDLFVVRVAGNVVSPMLVGSIELAAEAFGPRLVVVMGHTGCGAVDVTLAAVENEDAGTARHVNAIVEAVKPAVVEAMTGIDGERATVLDAAIRANVRASVKALRNGSSTLEKLIEEDGLVIVGAEYSLENGEVEFFEGVTTGD